MAAGSACSVPCRRSASIPTKCWPNWQRVKTGARLPDRVRRFPKTNNEPEPIRAAVLTVRKYETGDTHETRRTRRGDGYGHHRTHGSPAGHAPALAHRPAYFAGRL